MPETFAISAAVGLSFSILGDGLKDSPFNVGYGLLGACVVGRCRPGRVGVTDSESGTAVLLDRFAPLSDANPQGEEAEFPAG